MAVMDAAIFEAVTSHTNEICKTKIVNGFQEYFCYRCLLMFNSISPKTIQIYEEKNLYKMIFKIFDSSLNIQNGSIHSTNFKIFSYA